MFILVFNLFLKSSKLPNNGVSILSIPNTKLATMAASARVAFYFISYS